MNAPVPCVPQQRGGSGLPFALFMTAANVVVYMEEKAPMSYLDDMKRLLRLDGGAYADIMNRQRSLRYTVINVMVLGLIYGAASLYFSSEVLARSGVSDSPYNAMLVVMVGVSVAFLVHGAAALFIWVFCRALGGCPQFLPPYLNLGAAAIAAWPLAPFAARLQVAPNVLSGAAALVAAVYALSVGYTAVQAAAGLSRGKMLVCAIATLIYAGCFLYLWT